MAYIDFAGARSMKMPKPLNMVPETLDISLAAKQSLKGTPGFSGGKVGSGKKYHMLGVLSPNPRNFQNGKFIRWPTSNARVMPWRVLL